MNYKKNSHAVDDNPMAEKVASEGLQLAKQLNAEVALVSIADTSFLITEGSVTPCGIDRNH
ncbi:MAG: hypothetical protein ACXVPN_13790 [Bacteroidia bacterium]